MIRLLQTIDSNRLFRNVDTIKWSNEDNKQVVIDSVFFSAKSFVKFDLMQ